nr:hypothetical protein GCM10020092_074780 [Actinoplanes digitatis]
MPGGDDKMSADVRVFLGIVFGLPWVLWVFEQVTGVRILFFAAMLSVAIATWVAARYVWRLTNIAEATALVPVHPIRRTAGYCLLAFVLFIAMSALAVGFNAVTGLYPADLDGFSALRDVYGPATALPGRCPVGADRAGFRRQPGAVRVDPAAGVLRGVGLARLSAEPAARADGHVAEHWS